MVRETLSLWCRISLEACSVLPPLLAPHGPAPPVPHPPPRCPLDYNQRPRGSLHGIVVLAVHVCESGVGCLLLLLLVRHGHCRPGLARSRQAPGRPWRRRGRREANFRPSATTGSGSLPLFPVLKAGDTAQRACSGLEPPPALSLRSHTESVLVRHEGA